LKRKVRYVRTFLVRQVQTWEVDVPDDEFPELFPSGEPDDLGDFDQYACDNGNLVEESSDLLDYDELEGRVVTIDGNPVGGAG
jgi:hypothetical protein